MRLLTIAGFDGSGGAGLQADLRVFAELGCEGLSVVTALPVQNRHGVQRVYPVSGECVTEQLEVLLADGPVQALKVGMLHGAHVVEAVAQRLPRTPFVLDPVVRSSSGHVLLDGEGVVAMVRRLFPQVTVLTPNLPEAALLLGRPLATREEMEWAAKALASMGPKAVVLKGGHLQGNSCDDCLYVHGQFHWFSAPRVEVANTHGTGCVFSAALTVYLAKGLALVEAVGQAKAYLVRELERRALAAR